MASCVSVHNLYFLCYYNNEGIHFALWIWLYGSAASKSLSTHVSVSSWIVPLKSDEELTFFKLDVFECVPHLDPAVISLETARSQLHWAELLFQRSAKNNEKRLMIFPEIHLLLSFPSIKRQRGGAGTASCYKHRLVFGQMEIEKERRRQCETMREKQAVFYQGLAMHGGAQEETHSGTAQRLEEQCLPSLIRCLNRLNDPSGDYMEVKYIKIGKEEETHFCLDEAQPTFCLDMTMDF